MMSVQELMTSVSQWKVCYSESSNDIRSQYANRRSSPTAGILYTMTFRNYIILDAKWHRLALWLVTATLAALPYCNFKSYCANTKLYLILIYRLADCLKQIYLKATNNQYAFHQYTPMLLQLYILLTSNVLLLNTVPSLNNGLPKDLQVVFYTIIF